MGGGANPKCAGAIFQQGRGCDRGRDSRGKFTDRLQLAAFFVFPDSGTGGNPNPTAFCGGNPDGARLWEGRQWLKFSFSENAHAAAFREPQFAFGIGGNPAL